MGIDDDHVILFDRKLGSFCQESALSVDHIKKFAERMGVQDALPITFVFGGGDIEQPGLAWPKADGFSLS